MISVKEVDNIISENLIKIPFTECKTEDSYNEILQENIYADRDQPPFDRVAMDGIAINFSAWQDGCRSFRVEGIQGAGKEPLALKSPDSCLEVMTGAVLPENCNCVIKVEEIDFLNKSENKTALLKEGIIPKLGQNIHSRGADYKKDSLVLKQGALMLPPQVALAFSAGKAKLLVSGKPKIALIATGDELVGPDEEILPWQIRMSNTYAIYSALKYLNYAEVSIFHINDDHKLLEKILKGILEDHNILILSGGVSMGKYDYIPSVLNALNVKQLFHKVRQKPGKPLWFGRKDEKVVFGLPGNPVSSTICFYRYVLPFLRKSSGLENENYIPVQLNEDFRVKPGLTNFLPVKLINSPGNLSRVLPIRTNGSGDFASLSGSEGFIEVEGDILKKDSIVPFYSWRV